MSVPTGGFTAPPRETAQPVPYLASPWERLGAKMIDQLIVGSAVSVVAVPLMILFMLDVLDQSEESRRRLAAGEHLGFGDAFPPSLLLMWAAVFVLSALATMAYDTILTVKWGATVGKRVLRLKIIQREDGATPGWGRMAARSGFTVVLGLVPCVNWLDPLWVFLNPDKQALHDKVARTVVVKLPPPQPVYAPYPGH
ncbi:hypothetical protein Afil01_35040 [Actinorhabdospora filicis]|uniref:RDD domain-containing protein n=1 Tax=Actinorhabdospora filicis TaxID=1785913 RepID=A0A9W6W3Z1_9ACTN|nr:RDD family protein [Actinorhabdospora filicis]GLZ78697.1 hypothetical protein Afil01_35040 [Actinorhabdospora filicis]